jgi:hypothetical protein
MARKRKLKWGETPWDKMTKKECIRSAQMLYSAMLSCRYPMKIQQMSEPNSPFWSDPEGFGHHAVGVLTQALDSIHDHYDESKMYDVFFAYANDFLFTNSWQKHRICPECGTIMSISTGAYPQEDVLGKPCKEVYIRRDKNCDGIFREYTWNDLTPIKKEIE